MSTTSLRSIRVLPILAAVAFAAPAPLRAVQASDSLPTLETPRPLGAGILGGTLGSPLGLVAGAAVGAGMASCGSGGDFLCGVGEAMVGAAIGSALGAAFGANLAVRSAGGSPTLRGTFLPALAGIFLGGAAAWMGAKVEDSGALALIGFSLGQGTIAGLAASAQRSR